MWYEIIGLCIHGVLQEVLKEFESIYIFHLWCYPDRFAIFIILSNLCQWPSGQMAPKLPKRTGVVSKVMSLSHEVFVLLRKKKEVNIYGSVIVLYQL